MMWGGVPHILARNFLPEPHSIHGHGWQRTWAVSGVEPDAVTLTLDYPGLPAGDGWPWPYHARQRTVLSDRGITVTLSVQNRGDSPMPAGLGLHPYFPRPAGTQVRAAVTHRWERGDDMVPIGPRAMRPDPIVPTVDGDPLDHCFSGWSGVAEIVDPGGVTRITAQPEVFGHLVVFAPDREDYVCVEPVSHATNAVNLDPVAGLDLGLKSLQPGETLSGWVRIERELTRGPVDLA